MLEAALHRIQQAVDATERVSVGQAKSWLRAFSPHGKTSAGLLGRLSKIRNAKAHALSLRLSMELDDLLSAEGLGFGTNAFQGHGWAECARDSTFSSAPTASTRSEESLGSVVVALHERDIDELRRQRMPARLPERECRGRAAMASGWPLTESALRRNRRRRQRPAAARSDEFDPLGQVAAGLRCCVCQGIVAAGTQAVPWSGQAL